MTLSPAAVPPPTTADVLAAPVRARAVTTPGTMSPSSTVVPSSVVAPSSAAR